MATSHTQTILDQLRVLLPGAMPVSNVSSSRSKRDTLDEARTKTVEKLRENAAVFNGTSTDSVDSTCKKQADGRFAVGIKYGNRYLKDAIAGGTFVPNVSESMVPQVLDMLAKQVEQGMYDDAIDKIMKDNVSARSNTKH